MIYPPPDPRPWLRPDARAVAGPACEGPRQRTGGPYIPGRNRLGPHEIPNATRVTVGPSVGVR